MADALRGGVLGNAGITGGASGKRSIECRTLGKAADPILISLIYDLAVPGYTVCMCLR
jgi:hypothetical protein